MEEKRNVEELLDEVIREKFDLVGQGNGNEADVKALEALYRLRIDEKKADNERTAAEVERKEENRNWKIRLGVDIAAIVIPLAFYAHWLKLGFKFEEEGVYSSKTFASLFNKFRPGRL